MRPTCFLSRASRSEDGLSVLWNQCSVSALKPLRGEGCGSHSEVLRVCLPTLPSKLSTSKDVYICVRQAHTFIYA